ncbi:MAG TPA: ATP-binding cassette domain-containing protein [Thermoanaerobaculia bacterium]|nr:ATP-binding cassette domain-containing protein [Thermoanaerobaculia bacterium]
MAAIELRDLGVRYGRRTALAEVSLAVPEREVCAVLGRNGAGKTSLVRCLLGQQRPSAGEVRLLGEDPWRARARLMDRVGVVPEVPDAPPGLSARELSTLLRRVHRRWDDAAVRARLERFDVPLGQPFGRLSRGQKTLVQLALALGHEPELLVLDDPTLGLDALARRAVLEELVGELADRGVTVLLTTHDLAGVERIANRVAVLRDGRLLLAEELEPLKERYRGRAASPLDVVPLTLEEIFLSLHETAAEVPA